MRIISKKKDYYDGVAAHGMDMSLPYVRDIKAEAAPFYIPLPKPNTHPFSSRLHIIGFCGNVYPVIEIAPRGDTIFSRGEIVIRDGDTPWGDNPKPERMYHDFAHLDTFMRANLNEKELDEYDRQKIPMWSSINNVARWKKFYEDAEKLKDKFGQQFIDAKQPLFVLSEDHRIKVSIHETKQGIIWNPLLKNFNFAKVKDPFTAFQEIRMWLSNQAAPERPMKEMTNDETAARLGHGDRYSFRTPPSKGSK